MSDAVGDGGAGPAGEAPAVSVVISAGRHGTECAVASESVRAALAPHGISHEILVVGDEPRDAAARTARTARGRQVVFVDAALADAAALIPQMTQLLADGECDFVLGSRFVDGGAVDPQWSLLQRGGARFAALLARPLTTVRDPLSGLYGCARRALPDADRRPLLGGGSCLEVLVRGRFERARELPLRIPVGQGAAGGPSWRARLRYLRQLRRLYHFRYRGPSELLEFGFVGGTGFVVDLAFYLGLQWTFGTSHLVARALSFWVAATWNWALNRKLTFGARRRTRKRVQWPAFLASSLCGFALNWGTYYTLSSHVESFADGGGRILAMLLGVIVGMGLNFVLARTFVFLQHEDAPAPGGMGDEA